MILKEINPPHRTSSCSFLYFCHGYKEWRFFGAWRAFDFTSNNLLMPLIALITSIFVGFVIKPKVVIDEVETSGEFKVKKLFTFIIKYVAPVFIVLILVSSVLNAFGVIKI
jgi:SNF family Na+-dependent transporter